MSRRGQAKQLGKAKLSSKEEAVRKRGPQKLLPPKRSEVNLIVDKLLKVSSNIVSSTNVKKEWETFLEIQDLLSKLDQIEAEIESPSLDRRKRFGDFTTWLKENGAEFDGLKIEGFSGYEYGLMASKNFEEGDMLIAIPRKLMLTNDTAKDSVLGDVIEKDPMLQHMPNIALALLLLVEKFKEDSFWKPYISVLPDKYKTVLYFKTSELQELKGSPSLEAALKQCRNIARQYAYLNKLFQTNLDPVSDLLREVFTYKQYKWAVSTVMTRLNCVPTEDGAGVVNALIPMWDMCNHTNGKLTTDYNCTLQRSECSACQPFKPGEQVYIFYGARSNSDLFVHNGFVYPENEHDVLKVKLGVSSSDAQKLLRVQLLEKVGLPAQGEFLVSCAAKPVDGKMLSFVRILSMHEEDLQQWLSSERALELTSEDCVIKSEINELAWSFMLARFSLLLAAYPTTLEVDAGLLNTKKMSPCLRMAIQLRLCEKKILQGAINYVRQHVTP